MKHVGDITLLKGHMLPTTSVVTGGSPCQDLSVAGKRAGLQHGELGHEETTRSGLFMEQVRVIKEMREHDRKTRGTTGAEVMPRFMVWENVPGAFSSNKGEDFRAVLEETAKIADEAAFIPGPPKGKWSDSGSVMGDGWSIAYRVFDLQFWGCPQRRKRIYLVADFGGQTASEILFKRGGLQWDSETSGDERQRVAANTKGCAGSAGRHDAGQQEPGRVADVVLMDQGGEIMNIEYNKTGTLRAQMGGHLPCIID